MSAIRWRNLHLDPILLISLVLLAVIGLAILYSASNENMQMVEKQMWRLFLAFGLMVTFAQIPPRRYQQWAPWFFGIALFLLFAVLVIGKVDQGARRWIAFGPLRFQPSEMMKLALPMMLAWFLGDKPLPPKFKLLAICALILIVPALLTAKQPDLGTAIMITLAGLSVLLFAGINWKLVASLISLLALSMPFLWHFMHQYQKERVLTFLNPERAPLGSGYHIIQSKIAIGSGGLLGKGWLHGTQSHLSFLPAHATDFIFAVSAEELGLVGCLLIILLFLAIFARCLYMSKQAQNSFSRLLSGSLSLSFILSAFVNIGMVIGILPVVGVPLPLISYGGSSMLITMISFGMMMSVHTHRKLYSS
ncbi:MAG: rod shape-determining protein RodA [Coxiellaceae bacterium]|nr:rod shape-determining protein RodA [Coxiellaceae bacterium]